MSNVSVRRRIERAFPLIQLYLTVRGGAITGSEGQMESINNLLEEILDDKEVESRKKLDRRIARLNMDCGITDLIKDQINGHKFILSIYFLTTEIVERTNTIFPEKLVEIFQYFLDAESESPLSDEEVFKLRKSGEKQGKKLFIKLQSLGYYNG